MSEKNIRNLVLLGVAGAAIYYIFFRSSSAYAFPSSVAITPINPALIPAPAQAQPVTPQAGWLTGQSASAGW